MVASGRERGMVNSCCPWHLTTVPSQWHVAGHWPLEIPVHSARITANTTACTWT
ncbi:hypothetical protein DPMN_162485 [Dreissena polymorpha]|uniref:Uncharacterized protein n=1 Tax=Dreissena polymorpha TaxID=45954 RepID=A0A9D4ESD0_DREPO|nr:hypothetical protein DPMN_162485 [Dreissena polymorpha]